MSCDRNVFVNFGLCNASWHYPHFKLDTFEDIINIMSEIKN
jgi:hypothetical protein